MADIARLYFDLSYWRLSFIALLRGAAVTLELAVLAAAIGVSAGLLLATLRALGVRPLSLLVVVFVDVFRALPVIVVLFLLFFAAPYGGIRFSALLCAVSALSLNLAAVAEEAFWAGIQAVPPGQWEAGRALGLTPVVLLGRVVLPQAIRLSIPLITSKVISTTKDTAIASVVAVPELLNQMSTEQGIYANPSPLVLGSLMFLAMLVPLVRLSRRAERRFQRIGSF